MWLKATALGLGFQLMSMTERMADDQGFCELIGIPLGEYALDGCLLAILMLLQRLPRGRL